MTKLTWIKRLIKDTVIIAVISLVMIACCEVIISLFSLFYYRPVKGVKIDTRNKRVLCIGDSFTYGLYLPRNESYPSQLDSILRNDYNVNWTIINDGHPGHSPRMIHTYLEKTLYKTRPDLVILLAGFNINDGDIHLYSKQNLNGAGRSGNFILGFRALLHKLKTYRLLRYAYVRFIDSRFRFSEKLQSSMTLFSFKMYQEVNCHYYKKIIELLQQYNVDIVVSTYPQVPIPVNSVTRTECYYLKYMPHIGSDPLTDDDYLFTRISSDENAINSMIRTVAGQYSIPLVDIFLYFETFDEKEQYFLSDDEHPNSLGYRMMAQVIASNLQDFGLLGSCFTTN